MPQIVEYAQVLQTMRAQHMRSLYHNSGAFGFAEETETFVVGWLGPPDATIKPSARERATQFAAPFALNMSSAFVDAWRQMPGALWIMPMSHWAHELDFAAARWLPAALREIGIEAPLLHDRNTADAIEFAPDESNIARQFVEQLLDRLAISDFVAAFPGQPIVCTLHHHVQMWWQTSDAQRAEALRAIQIKNEPGFFEPGSRA